MSTLNAVLSKYHIELNAVAYAGDDLPDIEPKLRKVLSVVEGYLRKGFKEVVIFPFGEMGRIIKWLLESRTGIIVAYFIDNFENKESNVYAFESAPNDATGKQ